MPFSAEILMENSSVGVERGLERRANADRAEGIDRRVRERPWAKSREEVCYAARLSVMVGKCRRPP